MSLKNSWKLKLSLCNTPTVALDVILNLLLIDLVAEDTAHSVPLRIEALCSCENNSVFELLQ